MRDLTYTLLGEGTSDNALRFILTWTLRRLLREPEETAIQDQWADLSRIPRPVRTLAEKIHFAVELFPADILFIHRDADRLPRPKRVEEIRKALAACGSAAPLTVCVVPVRMTEAWLLFDEGAIRWAAGNPRGSVPLNIPPLSSVEDIPDPKQRLHEMLLKASELTGRRRKNFNVTRRVQNLAQRIRDFSPLRELPAYRAMEAELRNVLTQLGPALS